MNISNDNSGRFQGLKPFVPALAVVIVVGLVARVISWPGFATHDTIFLVQEAEAGVYTTYHPLLNGLLMRFLAVPFHSFWLYSSLQIVLCLLWFGRSVQLVAGDRPGAMWRSMLMVLVWALAVPTLLYLGMLWKDVPLAYGMAYVASLAYALRSPRGHAVTRLDSFLLCLAIVLTVGLRHGMEFNLVLYPLLLGVKRVVSGNSLRIPYCIALAVLLVLGVSARTRLVQNDQAHMLGLKISAVSQPFLSIVSNPNGYSSDDKGYDAGLASTTFGPDYARRFTQDYFRNEVQPKDIRQLEWSYHAILKRTPRLCALNIGQCLSGRMAMLLGTLQPATTFGGMTFYDLGGIENCKKTYGMDPDKCLVISEYESSEKPKFLGPLLAWAQNYLVETPGEFRNLYVWNLVPAFCLILFSLVFMSAKNGIWLISGFYAIEMSLPFATSGANDFRYYYFLALYFALFLPGFLEACWRAYASYRGRAKKQAANIGPPPA